MGAASPAYLCLYNEEKRMRMIVLGVLVWGAFIGLMLLFMKGGTDWDDF